LIKFNFEQKKQNRGTIATALISTLQSIWKTLFSNCVLRLYTLQLRKNNDFQIPP